MTTILQICFVTGIFVCFLAVLTQARYKAIIAFIICWFGFPNHVTHLIDIGGLPLFFFGEIAITLALCLVILIYHRDPKILLSLRQEKRILQILSITFLVQYVFGVLVVDIWSGISSKDLINMRLVGMINGFSAIIFFYACYKFIKTIDHVITMLKVFLSLSTLLALELLATLFISPISSVLSGESIKDAGGFFSIFLNDYHAVSIFSAVGVLSGLYLGGMFKKVSYFFAAVISCVPLFYNFGERAIFLGFLTGLSYLIIMNCSPNKRKMLISLLALVLPFGVYFLPLLLEVLGNYVLGFSNNTVLSETATKQLINIAQSDSMSVRLGIQLRGLEVIADFMPFGVGERSIQFYLQNGTTDIFRNFGSGSMLEGYNRVVSGMKVTELHNSYLDIVASYGLLGLISLLMVLIALFANWYNYLIKCSSYDVIKIGSIVFSLLLVLGIFYGLYSNPRIYVVFFTFFHISFLLSQNPNFFNRS